MLIALPILKELKPSTCLRPWFLTKLQLNLDKQEFKPPRMTSCSYIGTNSTCSKVFSSSEPLKGPRNFFQFTHFSFFTSPVFSRFDCSSKFDFSHIFFSTGTPESEFVHIGSAANVCSALSCSNIRQIALLAKISSLHPRLRTKTGYPTTPQFQASIFQVIKVKLVVIILDIILFIFLNLVN